MDKHYYFYREEEATNQFPDLVQVLGFTGACEELRLVLGADQLLTPEDVSDIAKEAVWRYFEEPHIPDNIVRGTE